MKKIQNWKFAASTAAILAGLGAVSTPALSQDSAAAEDDDDGVIVVTARKAEENILETPIAITAFGEEQIKDLGLTNINDLPAFTPGFNFESFSATPGRYDNSPRFRGVNINTSAPTRQTASVFVDGVFVANGSQGILLSDVERVEIIKGPQSAFFGRNTFGGAVNYITKTPGNDFGVDYSATVGTRDLYDVNLGVDLPVSDAIKLRVNGGYKSKGGHYRNTAGLGEKLGDEETWSISGTLFVEPSDNFDAKLRVNYFENEDGPPTVGFVDSSFHNCGGGITPLGGTDTYFCGVLPINAPGLNTDISATVLDFYQNTLFQLNGSPRSSLGLDRQSLRTSFQFNVSFPDSSVVFSSLSALNYDEVNLLQDGDFTGDSAFISYSGRQFRDISQEVRFTGNSLGERLNWSIGANFFDQRFTSNGEFIVPAFGRFAFGNGEPNEEQITTIGVFGSLGFDITDGLTLTAEARYQNDEISQDNDITDTVGFVKGSFKSFLPRVILNYQATPDTLVYASFSEGNLPGGFNTAVSALSATELARLNAFQVGSSGEFAEEELRNYEIGLKHNFGGAGYVSIAAFYMDRINQIVRRADRIVLDVNFTGSPLDTTTQINHNINIGASEIKGIEFEGSYELVEGFTLSATAAYIDSELTAFRSGFYEEVFGTPEAAGQRAERHPRFTGSMSAQYEGELSNDWGFFMRADGFYTSSRFANEINLARTDAGFQANLRAGVKSDNVRIEAFVTNVTDDDTPTAINRFRDLSLNTPLFDFGTFGHNIGLRDRRQFGLRVSGSF